MADPSNYQLFRQIPRHGKTKSLSAIYSFLTNKKIKRDVDVKELYLADSELEEVEDLSPFKYLGSLWLNGNKLRRIDCLENNFRLCELYLHNNALVDIQGALAHLTCLQVLHLQENQLRQLDVVVEELRNMQSLHTLNLFDNPVAQELGYRVYVIHFVPSVKLLDRQEVQRAERDHGERLYNQAQVDISEKLAFGRRSEGPPALYYPSSSAQKMRPTKPAAYEVGNNFYRDNPPYANEDQAINTRAQRRSIMEFSYFDWSKLPRADERRITEKPFETPQIITTRFR